MKDEHSDVLDPRDPAVLLNQRRAYGEMRERRPVAHSAFLGWSLFRYADVTAAVAGPLAFSNVARFPVIPNSMDSPVHDPYYEVLAQLFDQKHMATLEPRIREIAASLLQPVLDLGEADFIEAFTTPFALKSVCAFLGWPDQQWKCLAGWVHDNQDAAFNQAPEAGKVLAELFAEHVRANLESHRASPGQAGDATDALLRTQVERKTFTDDEIISILRNWAAGHRTVAAGLGILILHLVQNPDLQVRLRHEPSLIPAAIEEILRVDDPLVANRRTKTRALKIQGRTIPKGDTVTLMWIAANRDPRTFEAADVVVIERNTDASLVWGQGIHLCLGAPLARLEMRVALEELLARTTCIELTGAAPQRAVYPGDGLAALSLRAA